MESPENVCEESVFQKIFEANSRDLYKFLYYKYGEDQNPEDLVQDAFVKLWNNCKKVIPEKARSFLFTVANNQMLNELARRKTALNYQQQKNNAYTQESPQYILEENEYMNRLQSAITSLSPEHRAAFMLNRIEGKKHKEIAEILDLNSNTVMTRLFRARNQIKELFTNDNNISESPLEDEQK